MKKYITFVIVLMLMLTTVVSAKGDLERIGEIVAVNTNQDTILLKSREEMTEYKLALNATIQLNNRDVSLKALRPIKGDNFQQARIELNKEGKIETIDSFYRSISIIVEEVNKQVIIFKNLNTGQKIVYDLKSNLDIIRNNYSASLTDIRVGDQGVVVLGINNQLQKLVLHHYQDKGVIKEIDKQEKEITVNIGTRSEPQLKTFQIQDGTNLINNQQKIKFKDLAVNQWVKLEVDKQVKLAVVRNI
ncbi:hypothetical protein JCM16358_13900 [Halanaerocella petrolearia]